MAVSSHRFGFPVRSALGSVALNALVLLVVSGCSAGQGEGALDGRFTSSTCGMTDADLGIEATFFSIEHTEDLFEIRVQDGSDFEDRSDGIIITVRDASEVKREWLGRPIPVGGGSLVEVSLYMNETCGPSFGRRPVNFRANEGTVTFEYIYAPSVDPDDMRIAGSLDGLRLVSGPDADSDNAEVSGWFRFYFNRGRPAQRFP